MCGNNTIFQLSINLNSTNGTNATTLIVRFYVIRLYYTPRQQKIMDYLSLSLGRTSSILAPVAMLTRSNPYTFAFLSFINFFTLSSHYVLLNTPLPEQLYDHLSHFYVQVNSNLLSRYLPLPFSKTTRWLQRKSAPH